MFNFMALLSLLGFALFTVASPFPQYPTNHPSEVLSRDSLGSNVNISTPLGTARGVINVLGAARYSVRYATAQRWSPSIMAKTWDLPNGSKDITALPLACPQPNMDSSSYTEDCLSMVLYVPKTSYKPTSPLPTMVWIHGGSFIVGSATGPGLDGSNLATATNSIVAVIQYRLGALGFMAPDGSTNLAVKDVVNALAFLKKVVPAFSGNPNLVTIAGQSSGANMIRALLAVPSASTLFKSAILQSDPMNYGFLSATTQKKMQTYFNSKIGCSASDKNCLNGLSLNAIIGVQTDLCDNAITLDPSTDRAEPIRPVKDGSLITSPLDSTAPFPAQSKSILISTVNNEAALTIFSVFTDPLPADTFPDIVNATFGPSRTQTILSSPHYAINSSDNSVDARNTIETLGTDYLWKCSSWTLARNWVMKGGKAFVGMYALGASYPGNEQVPICTKAGVVCHQDDIEIVFGTVPHPTTAQSALTKKMQTYYRAFLSTGDPNGNALPQWKPATTTDVHALLLGGSGEVPVGACDPAFWGQAVQYDYQVFGI